MEKEKIYVYDRELKKMVEEKVYGESGLRFLYGDDHGLGRWLSVLLAQSWWSSLYGWYQNTHHSANSIPEFVEQYQIPMDQYQKKSDGYNSFNDFFIRPFADGARVFTTDSDRLAAFAEGRYLAYSEVLESTQFPVKGKYLKASDLLGKHQDEGRKWVARFEGGPMMIARLCPVDYHRFHFPDDGKIVAHYRVKGKYHSVNPWALKTRPDVFIANERQISILETNHFGMLAYIEVGAMSVGKIVQTHPQEKPFKRGEEKGHFLFGGSTVILLGEKGKWIPDADLTERTGNGVESLVRLGTSIGKKK